MLWQLTVNGVSAGALYAIIAVGFALIYNVTKFFHFTHGILFTIGAFAGLVFYKLPGAPFPVAIVLVVGTASFFGSVLYWFFYRPLQRQGASVLVLLLASLGMYIAIQNVISISFGDEIETLNQGHSKQTIEIAGALVNVVQLFTCFISVIVVGTTAVLLRKSRIGRAIRAVSSNQQLASLCGVEVERIALLTFAVGSGLSGLAGLLNGLDVDLTPTMGLAPLMMAIIAVIVGGKGSIIGIACGALLLGLSQHVGIWKIGSQWQETIAFLLLVAFLLFRPTGFVGSNRSRRNV